MGLSPSAFSEPQFPCLEGKGKNHLPERVPPHSPFSLGSKLLRLSQLSQWG